MAVRWNHDERGERLITLDRLSRFRPRDAFTVAQTLWWVVVARGLIAVRGFHRIHRKLGLSRVEPVDVVPGAVPLLPLRSQRTARVALKLLDAKILEADCIPRSVALQRVLRRAGIDADLVIGCLTEDEFKAHAWVEIGGYPVGFEEVGARRWMPLARFRLTGAGA